MKKAIFILCTILLLVGIIFFPKLKKLYNVIHLFDEDVILRNFQNMDKLSEVKNLKPSTKPLVLPEKKEYQFRETFDSNGENINVQNFLDEVNTEGLLIIHNDTIIYEDYKLDLQPDEPHVSWSVAKSFVSTLAGVMIDQGKLDVTQTVDYYLEDFKNTGYENVKIEDVMQMSSGVKFNEDYGDYNSDINRFGRVFAMGKSFEEFSKTLINQKLPGTYNHYVSIDTQVLALVIAKVSGEDITSLTQKYIWEPCGMEHRGYWIVDDDNFELALGGLNATLRDYSKLGLLYLHKGSLNGNDNLLSERYIEDATTALKPHLQPNANSGSDNLFGYGYQWWLPQHPEDDFFASGIYYQHIYVNRSKNLVITKLSADPHFNDHKDEYKQRHVHFFQDIARHI